MHHWRHHHHRRRRLHKLIWHHHRALLKHRRLWRLHYSRESLIHWHALNIYGLILIFIRYCSLCSWIYFLSFIIQSLLSFHFLVFPDSVNYKSHEYNQKYNRKYGSDDDWYRKIRMRFNVRWIISVGCIRTLISVWVRGILDWGRRIIGN
jgi:hypothetical protein